ncbi:MAG: ROK family protein, partial [Candidatus Binatia bacterium]
MAAGVGRYVGIDLGGTKIEGVVLGEDLSEIVRRRAPPEREKGYEHIVGRITDLVTELRARVPDCRRIGVGTPGSLSARDGTLKNSNTTCLNGRPLHADLERRLGVEVVIENDANCFALAEVRAGAARGARLAFGVILGTGVGGGIVVDGRVWTGLQHVAGEWGHHCIADDGPECYCGQRGCVETFLSGPALERAYREGGGEACGAAEVARRAETGDARAAEVLDRYVDRFGRALANVVNILDPAVVVLGGG